MSILTKILQEKEREVAVLQKNKFPETIRLNVPLFSETVRKSKTMPIIAEIKRASPSKGAINMDIDPVLQAKRYEALGASAISVLTDSVFFNGAMDDLRAVSKAVNLPVLCKDFIIDPVQIDRAKSSGASMILLIVAALSAPALNMLHDYARKSDLEVLMEVHNEEELVLATTLGANIIGINNRDLNTFQVNLQTTEKLAAMIHNEKTILVSESGIKKTDDVIRVKNAGAAAILVGETLMLADDLQATFQQLQIGVNGNDR